MKNVLIITYYFPPVKGAAPWRPYSWAVEFKKHGLNPVILTRHWKGNESHWSEFVLDNHEQAKEQENDMYRIIHLPSKKFWLYRLTKNNLLKIGFFSKLFFFLTGLTGYFNIEVDAYATFKKYLKQHLSTTAYDYIVLTYPPSNLLKLIPVIVKNSDAKIILDIRDLWNNYALQNEYAPPLKQQFNDALHNFHTKKYLKYCSIITVVTPSFIPFFTNDLNIPVKVIYNGYEASIISELKKTGSSAFNISYIGNLYAMMDLTVMVEGLKSFLKDKDPKEVSVNFIGLGSNAEMKSKIVGSLPEQFLFITPMLNKDEALQHTINSNVLLQYGWKGFSGMIGTKTFDYLASGNNILLAPGDDDIVDDLITKTKTGRMASTPTLFAEILNEWFNEWKTSGNIKYEGIQNEIAFYSRENQAAEMAELIVNL